MRARDARRGGGHLDELRGLLEREQIRLLEPPAWTPEIREYLNGYFSREICPVLTPLAFDPGHPFPFISNLSKNFAVVVRHGGRTKFARVKVPDVLPRFVPLPESAAAHGPHTFVFLEDVIRANIHELFPGTQVNGAHLFRIIRDADLEIEDDEADDLLESVDRSLRQLRRGADLAAAGRGRHAGARAQHPRRELRGRPTTWWCGRPSGSASATGCS